ncbi:LacI family DNA-binding transcriptional regulator [Foetidibacter luteolus]|uniref:LacI family DNA-binding transcriptional regulator n=1 Tax=Foetidibacter luteolus TaxID=2608880 RepID=UPI00129ADAA6|nr:substrate-binding domain-containing protein [Foetidibacter luteolus]
MNKKVSLKDIAQKLGVSTALVSYVLNNRRENRISKEVAQKIRDAARAMNYKTNQIARSLKTNKTNTIGLLVADISNPFDAALARIIEDEAEKQNYAVLFGSSDGDARKLLKLLDILATRQVEGLIIFAAEHAEEQIGDLLKQGTPFVLIDRYFPGLDASYVALDNHEASLQAINHLAANGFKNIGLVTYNTSLFHMQERKRGYLSAMAQHHLPVHDGWVQQVTVTDTRQQVEAAIDEMLALPHPVHALLFTSNVVAIHGVKYINKLGLKVPQQMAIVTFDETEALDMFYAPLTYLKQPLKQMGAIATQVLLQKQNGNSGNVKINLPAELVVRASSIAGPGVL